MQEQTLASDWRLWLIDFWLFRPMGNKIKEPIRLEFNSYRNATQAKVSMYSHKASRGKRRRRRRIRNKETKKMEKNTKDVEITRIVLRFVSIRNSICIFDAFRIVVVPMLSKTLLNAHKIVSFLTVYE